MTEEKVSLANLLLPSMEAELDFPGLDGFKVKLCHLGRDYKAKLIKKATKTKFVKHIAVSELDDDAFLKEFTKATVKGWTGLKYKYLIKMLPMNIGSHSLEDCLPYTEENAELFLGNSEEFDSWVAEVVGDLENFIQDK